MNPWLAAPTSSVVVTAPTVSKSVSGTNLSMQQLARNEDPVRTHAMFSDLIDLNASKPNLKKGI